MMWPFGIQDTVRLRFEHLILPVQRTYPYLESPLSADGVLERFLRRPRDEISTVNFLQLSDDYPDNIA
jgi:hypothetical protein